MKRTQVIKPTAKQLRSFIVEAASAAQEKLEEQRLTKLAKGARLSESTIRRIIREETTRVKLIESLNAGIKRLISEGADTLALKQFLNRAVGETDISPDAKKQIIGQIFDQMVKQKTFDQNTVQQAVDKALEFHKGGDEDVDAAVGNLGAGTAAHAGEGKLEDKPQPGVGKQRTGNAAPTKAGKQEPDWGKLGFKQAPKRAVG
jgi:hypothetical protein